MAGGGVTIITPHMREGGPDEAADFRMKGQDCLIPKGDRKTRGIPYTKRLKSTHTCGGEPHDNSDQGYGMRDTPYSWG